MDELLGAIERPPEPLEDLEPELGRAPREVFHGGHALRRDLLAEQALELRGQRVDERAVADAPLHLLGLEEEGPHRAGERPRDGQVHEHVVDLVVELLVLDLLDVQRGRDGADGADDVGPHEAA